MCYIAVDSNGLTSDRICYTIAFVDPTTTTTATTTSRLMLRLIKYLRLRLAASVGKCYKSVHGPVQVLRQGAAWSQWSNWSECFVACHSGWNNRTRECSAPNECGVLNVEQKDFYGDLVVCYPDWPVVYSSWSSYGCSGSCGGGYETVYRNCITGSCLWTAPREVKHNQPCNQDISCKGKGRTVTADGSYIPRADTPLNQAAWSKWGNWSRCLYQLCEPGWTRMTRIRECSARERFALYQCDGPNLQQKDCFGDLEVCYPDWPVVYSPWSSNRLFTYLWRRI